MQAAHQSEEGQGPRSLAQLKRVLGGLTPGTVPIASAKRLSTAIALDGQHFRIGSIWANQAFVVRRGQVNLLYVHVDYKNYAQVGCRIFAPTLRRDFDYDHALGRAIATELGFSYVLLIRVPRSVNRAHGRYERPTPHVGVNLKKTPLTDARIFRKMLGLKAEASVTSTAAYDVNASHNPPLDDDQFRTWAFALGVDLSAAPPLGLTRIHR